MPKKNPTDPKAIQPVKGIKIVKRAKRLKKNKLVKVSRINKVNRKINVASCDIKSRKTKRKKKQVTLVV